MRFPRTWLRASLLAALAALAGCEDGAGAVDVGPVDVGARDGAAVDGAGDARADAGPDAAADALVDGAVDQSVDAAVEPDMAPDPLLAPCAVTPSARADGALRVAGCRLVRGGEAAVLPKTVAVSGDSLARAAATPLHAPEMYVDLAGAGVDVVWLVVLWDGIEPMRGTYNGAYLGRVCEQARWAGAAGLDVVLAMSQQRFGPALGGHGMPPWITPEGLAAVPIDADPRHPSLDAAWRSFWGGDGPEALTAAWIRLLDTCAQDEAHGIDGVLPLESPRGDADSLAAYGALSAGVEVEAEARLGPMLVFESPMGVGAGSRFLAREGADIVRVVSGWGPGGWPGSTGAPSGWRTAAREAATRASRPLWVVGVGGETPDAMAAALAEVEADGLVGVVWQDGFGTPYGLRDDDGVPAALWGPALNRPRPARVAGRPLSWRADDAGITFDWLADGSEQGLSRFDMAGRLPGMPALSPSEGVEWFTDYDPATGLLAIFVEGAPGVVQLTVPIVAP